MGWWLLFILLILQCIDGNIISKPKNRIVFEENGIPIKIAQSFLELESENGQFQILSTNQNQTYLCHLPQNKEITVKLPEFTMPIEELKSKALEILFSSFSNQNCTFNYNILANYWTIGYCFGDKIIQFHEELEDYMSGNHKPSIPKHIYTLGRFPGSEKFNKKVKIRNQAGKNKVSLNPVDFSLFEGDYSIFENLEPDSDSQNTQKFLKHTLLDGELCDLTNRPRSIDIVYKCDLTIDYLSILEIQEIKTCHYQMIINVPKLCTIEEFKKNIIHDNIVDIKCKSIDFKNDEEKEGPVSFDDFFKFPNELPIVENRLFPNKNNYKIDLNDYYMYPMGSGYYLGTRNESLKTSNPYWNNRMIFIYAFDKVEDTFPSLFASLMDRRIPSPVYINTNMATSLSWTDSFIAWYEIYNIFGDFIALFRIERDGNSKTHQLEIQKVDPMTLKDSDGDSVIIDKFIAPNNQWNFETFFRPNLQNVIGDKVTETVTVTIGEIGEIEIETETAIINLEAKEEVEEEDINHDEL
ncbi:unnamed protein product [Candida verbasci]|uniref:Endoplasmic reticulum lectin n=1 Tax=Candida verbasci TaxID=1227364 RepID=A0A9W4X8G0_9ASCO|nr:unnamed protein product [Candida verbasci]